MKDDDIVREFVAARVRKEPLLPALDLTRVSNTTLRLFFTALIEAENELSAAKKAILNVILDRYEDELEKNRMSRL